MINIAVGQAGCNIAEAFWNLISKEHNIDLSGKRDQNQQQQKQNQFNDNYLFDERQNSFTPRALLIDLDKDNIDYLKQRGPLKSLLKDYNYVAGKEDASNNYDRAYYNIGKTISDPCIDRMRKEVEKIDYFQGFQMFHSIVGGTGSGLATLLLDRMNIEFPKKQKFNYTLLPSLNHSDCVISFYNAVLSLNKINNNSDMIVYMNNQALNQIVDQRLGIEESDLRTINDLISLYISLITTNQRMNKSKTESMQSITQAAVPFPSLKHLIPNYAPLTPLGNVSIDVLKNQSENIENTDVICQQNSINNLTYECIQERNSFLPCKYKKYKYFCISSFYRGQDINMQDIYQSQNQLIQEEKLNFVISNMKFSNFLTDQCPIIPFNNYSLLLKRDHGALINSAAFSQVLNRLGKQFDILYNKRSFIHWFVGDGMSEDEVSEARETISSIENNYIELQNEVE